MHEVRWFAFFPALVLAPLVLAVPSLLIMFAASVSGIDIGALAFVLGTSIVAVGMGAPTYLTFGLAGFVWALKKFGPDAPFLMIAFVANLGSAPFVLALLFLLDASDEWQTTAFTVGFGCIFAPIWGALFGWIYRSFVRKGDALRRRAHGSC